MSDPEGAWQDVRDFRPEPESQAKEEQELQDQMGLGDIQLEWSFIPIDRGRHSAHVHKLIGAGNYTTVICCSCGIALAIDDEATLTAAEETFREHARSSA